MVVVFGVRNNNSQYSEYSDHLQWDHEKHSKAWKTAKDSDFGVQTCNFYELYLSTYYEKQIEITCIEVMCNLSTGYPVINFSFKDKNV